ncbi:MAG TPA: protocatechuate 3,4-dioxygenase subunit beta [Micropepsaceae bacterium]|jgi:protocatechuate 3,4-dioxygenase beta subunit
MTGPVPYAREDKAAQPPLAFPAFKASVARAPSQPPIRAPQTLTEITGPSGEGVWERLMGPALTDLTRQHRGEPVGERIIVSGRVLDENGRPVPNTMIEILQANAAGRYVHQYDQHDAPLDENFTGAGRVISDAGGNYRFITIKPGAYPWYNQRNAWRPAHIHFSLMGAAFANRLITQMYFPGDPLFGLDAIANAVPEPARERIVARFDPDTTEPFWALGYRFDFVLRGRDATPMEH